MPGAEADLDTGANVNTKKDTAPATGNPESATDGATSGADPENGSAPLSVVLQYATLRARNLHTEASLRHRHHLHTLRRLQSLNEKQNSDLVDLRNCIEYINQHSNIIQNALREASETDAAVPVCSNIVKDIITVRNNIQESINNSLEIKELLGANYEPLMENLLKKMENQLNNWSGVLNIASRNLLNSKALIENIQNLIVTQQQLCSEVVESELFSNLNIDARAASEISENDTVSSEMFEKPSCFCSTPTRVEDFDP